MALQGEEEDEKKGHVTTIYPERYPPFTFGKV